MYGGYGYEYGSPYGGGGGGGGGYGFQQQQQFGGGGGRGYSRSYTNNNGGNAYQSQTQYTTTSGPTTTTTTRTAPRASGESYSSMSEPAAVVERTEGVTAAEPQVAEPTGDLAAPTRDVEPQYNELSEAAFAAPLDNFMSDMMFGGGGPDAMAQHMNSMMESHMRMMNQMMGGMMGGFPMLEGGGGGGGGPLALMGGGMGPGMGGMMMHHGGGGGGGGGNYSYSSSSSSVFISGSDGKPKFAATSSARSGPGGVYEARRAVMDQERGSRMGHHRSIQGRGHTRYREQRPGRPVHESEQLHNLRSHELGDFHNEWRDASRDLPALPSHRHSSSSHHRQLGDRSSSHSYSYGSGGSGGRHSHGHGSHHY